MPIGCARRAALRPTATGVLLCLLLCGGCQNQPKTEPEEPAAPQAQMPEQPAPNPLAGTSWEIVTAIGDVTRNFDRAFIYFSPDGELRTRIDRKDGRTTIESSRYELDDRRISTRADLGYESSATYQVRGEDEIVIDTTRARLVCRRTDVIPQTPTEKPYEGPVSVGFEVAHPLAGTKWDVVSAVGNINTNFDAASIEFTADGYMVIRIHRPDGTVNVDEARFRGDDQAITFVGNLGRAVTAEFRRQSDELTIEFPNARVKLRRAGPASAPVAGEPVSPGTDPS